jgi:hypothetical protein
MAEDPEALTQLSRLLEDERLRGAKAPEVQDAVERDFQRLVDGMVAEAAASDDVMDRETALTFVDTRLDFLASLLSNEQRSRLRRAVRARIEAW